MEGYRAGLSPDLPDSGSWLLTCGVPNVTSVLSPWSVFLDRDGVLNHKAPEGNYIKTWSEFSWLPGSLEALRKLHQAGLRVFIVTNQQGVAKGMTLPANLDDIHRRLRAEVSGAGGQIEGIYVCPHLAGSCKCRKPGTQLFQDARRDFPEITFERSIVVGDAASDVEAGRRIGARTILVGNRVQTTADGAAPTLLRAVEDLILPWTSQD
jgi:D-glycero-D-manno-heptose 1,7-bisphosphate phosphatase